MKINKRKRPVERATRKMTKAEVQAWAKRWQLVNAREIEELRKTPAHIKLRQLETLMQWAKQMNWSAASPAENERARQRWQRLRNAYGG